jgi:hypothetical protein
MLVTARIVSAVAVLSVAAAAAQGSAASPSAHAARKAYCSPSGDYCYGLVGGGGPIRLSLRLAARYFTRYDLCVTPPRGPQTCRSFPLHRRKYGIYASRIRWARHFPNRGRGHYKARWFSPSGDPMGPHVTFTR